MRVAVLEEEPHIGKYSWKEPATIIHNSETEKLWRENFPAFSFPVFESPACPFHWVNEAGIQLENDTRKYIKRESATKGTSREEQRYVRSEHIKINHTKGKSDAVVMIIIKLV